MFSERKPFTEEEKQLILKIQSDDFILKCKAFFANKGIGKHLKVNFQVCNKCL